MGGTKKMPILVPNVPPRLSYAVIAAIALNLIALIMLIGAGVYVGEEIAFVIAGATYLFVYRWLGGVGNARGYAGLLALCDAGFAVASYTSHQSTNIVLVVAAAAVCLGYAFLQFPAPARS